MVRWMRLIKSPDFQTYKEDWSHISCKEVDGNVRFNWIGRRSQEKKKLGCGWSQTRDIEKAHNTNHKRRLKTCFTQLIIHGNVCCFRVCWYDLCCHLCRCSLDNDFEGDSPVISQWFWRWFPGDFTMILKVIPHHRLLGASCPSHPLCSSSSPLATRWDTFLKG